MANSTVIHQPGISYQKEYSGSVQYIGGYEGPYVDNEDVFVQQAPGSSDHVPIPMGLEVFENVSKFVTHQNVAKEDGKLVFNLFAPYSCLHLSKTVARKSVN